MNFAQWAQLASGLMNQGYSYEHVVGFIGPPPQQQLFGGLTNKQGQPDPNINNAINALMQQRGLNRNDALNAILQQRGTALNPHFSMVQFNNEAQQAIQQAQQQYPWTRHIGMPIKLFPDVGVNGSESYDPKEGYSPYPGQFSIGLRNQYSMNPQNWPATIGRETMDYMAQHDPKFENVAKQFTALMQQDPEQLKVAQGRWKAQGSKDSFDEFMRRAEAQEWISGYVGGMPGWRNMPYSPAQRNLLDAYQKQLYEGQPPVPINLR